jgi:hypothetical protein
VVTGGLSDNTLAEEAASSFGGSRAGDGHPVRKSTARLEAAAIINNQAECARQGQRWPQIMRAIDWESIRTVKRPPAAGWHEALRKRCELED